VPRGFPRVHDDQHIVLGSSGPHRLGSSGPHRLGSSGPHRLGSSGPHRLGSSGPRGSSFDRSGDSDGDIDNYDKPRSGINYAAYRNYRNWFVHVIDRY